MTGRDTKADVERIRNKSVQATARSQRLSGTDAAFLYLERKELPLHIAGVCVFEREIPFEGFVQNVASRLHTVPRYRQIVSPSPHDVSYPSWKDDRKFDIRRHVFHTRLEAPGGQAELEALSGRILSQVMDRRKPLWDIHVIDGLEGGRGAVIIRIHHALADGISGAAVFLEKLILDRTPDAPAPVAPARVRKPKTRAARPSLAAEMIEGARSSLDHLISAEAGIASTIDAVVSSLCDADMLRLTELFSAVESLPFNKLCRGERKFCWAEFDFDKVKAIKAAAGGSVNDVILTILTRAVGRYVRLHGQPLKGRRIRIVCPVNLRRDNGESLGNQITFMPVVLPMDTKDPVQMLKEVSARTTVMKQVRAADFIAFAANLIGITPPLVQKMLWRGISQAILPLPLFNMICTNIAGSQEPLFCVGRRMLAFYPQVPTGWELGINCAASTYNGKLFFGLIADSEVAGDVTRLRDFLYPAFDELCRAAGIRKPRRAIVQVKRKRPSGFHARPANVRVAATANS